MEHTPKTVVVEGERRRRRPAMKRKLRCNRQRPCSNCIRAKAETCVYESHNPGAHASAQNPVGVFFLDPDAPRSAPAQSVSNASPNESLSTRNATSNLATRNLISPLTPRSQDESIANRSVLDAGKPWYPIRDFCSTQPNPSPQQQQQQQQQQPRSQSPYESPETDFLNQAPHITGGAIHFHRGHNAPNSTEPALIRSVTHKTRFFGQSHWINVFQVFKNMFVLNDVHLLEEKSNTYPLLLKCKSLARIIKAKRNPPWPTIPTRDLPERQVCDKLIDCYLKTTENIYRILHLPSFRRDYEELWEPGAFPDIAFVVHLKLVLALGTICYDEEFSMRSSAIRWVYEAQTWISEPEFKARLGIQFIQTHILLLLAREAVGVAGDSVWVSAGDLVRRAMHMGLHRDPHHLPKRSLYATQMHRRLWNTILEMLLKMSLSSGGPPLICPDDFDTEPPGNFDDEQLMTEGVEKPENEYTSMSIALALRKTLHARLAVASFLNDLTSCGTYERTLELDAELRSAYKVLAHTLRGFKSKQATGEAAFGPSDLDLRFVDFIMQRHISALHTPYFIPALRQTKYAVSRKLAIEATLKIWAAAFPSSAIMSHRHIHGPSSSSSSSASPTSSLGNEDLLTRLSHNGPGFYRAASMQASLLITAELDTQLRDEQGLVPLPLRADLLSVIREAQDCSLRSIKSGETNVKGYLVTCVIISHIEAIMRGVDPSEIPPLFRKASEEAMELCVRILEERAGQSQDVGAVDEEDDMGIGMRQQSPDWDFLISDAMFAYNTGLHEPMNWFLSDGTR
ncbi:hypothetical protein LI328DRAFT_146885 [Trichoderma asperelloides]|nr:hypothetical protein LI328DRAFT_146885 [Trichoderma asperelloides]